jgi:hypothetical protein
VNPFECLRDLDWQSPIASFRIPYSQGRQVSSSFEASRQCQRMISTLRDITAAESSDRGGDVAMNKDLRVILKEGVWIRDERGGGAQESEMTLHSKLLCFEYGLDSTDTPFRWFQRHDDHSRR